MKIQTQESGRDVSVLHLVGDLDIYSSPALRRSLRELLARRRSNIIIDVENVPYIDSTGIGVFIEAVRQARLVGGQLSIVTSADRIKKLFLLLGLTTTLPIFIDVRSALRSV